MRKVYKVEVVSEGALGTIFLGASRIRTERLETVLNAYGQQGWDLEFMVLEKRRFLLFWVREAVVITFSRGA